ncbi:MAG: hypothetical protein JWQ81_8577 [Amycolatopsis sp.]|uniref:hypothetical protein n=1 Tax=Amycolatopsis sp. TaxID=37632 RepID=UPI0026287560|nr:hypothetical protein [Amycolatopsis sp.]MCU1687838.1 hypothetical protein [Amycolatopsis sp.]
MITLYGASDDLIEIDGDIREEFNPADGPDGDTGDLVTFSNGLVLRIRYTDGGFWRIDLVHGQDLVEIVPCPEDDEKNYSDRATITGPVDWVTCGNTIARPHAARLH